MGQICVIEVKKSILMANDGTADAFRAGRNQGQENRRGHR